MSEALLDALRAAGSPHIGAIEQSLAAGRTVHGSGMRASIPELLATYRLRREHLARFRSAHAEALHRDVAALVHNLERTECQSCEILSVQAGETLPRSYVIFFVPEEGRLLGCCAAVSRFAASEREWADLWGDT